MVSLPDKLVATEPVAAELPEQHIIECRVPKVEFEAIALEPVHEVGYAGVGIPLITRGTDRGTGNGKAAILRPVLTKSSTDTEAR